MVAPSVKGRTKLGVEAFANAFLVIPKTLSINSGYDAQEVIVKLLEAYQENNPTDKEHIAIGIDLESGEPFVPQVFFYPLFITKKFFCDGQMIS